LLVIFNTISTNSITHPRKTRRLNHSAMNTPNYSVFSRNL
jgi:hypothetical protein